MFKKIVTYVLYGVIVFYIIFAPRFLTGTYTDKYLIDVPEEPWTGIITMWDIPRHTINGSKFGWIKGRIDEFEKKNPGIHIDLRELHYNDNDIIAFEAAKNNDHPDIMPLFIKGEIIPLDNVKPVDYLDEDESLTNIKEELIGALYYDERIWGTPVYYSLNVLIINKELLDYLEVDIPEEWTFENFLTLLKEINENDSKNNIAPFDLYIEESEYSYMPFFFCDGGEVFSSNEIGYNFYDSDVLSGLEKLKLIMENTKNLPEDFGARSKSEIYESFFINKQTAIIAGSLKDVNYLIKRNNQGRGFEYIVMPYPKGNTDLPVFFVDEVGSYALMETKDKGKEKAMKDFLKFLLGEESQQSIEIMGKLPVVSGYDLDLSKYPHLEELNNNSSFLHIIPFNTNWKQIEEKIITQLKKTLINNRPASETLFYIQQSINSIVEK